MTKHLLKTFVAFVAIAAMAMGPVRGQNGNVSWVLTPYGDLQTGDTVVIVDKTSARALPKPASSSSAPGTISVTLNSAKDTLTSTPGATLKWVVVRDGDNYKFRKPGTDNEYLYFTGGDNGVRVGNNENNQFSFENGGTYNVPFLKNNATTRYFGLTNTNLWRSLSDNSTSTIKNTVIGFYKKTVIPTHTVRMAAGTEEAANWSIASGNASVPGTQVLENVMSGSQVTATYSGTRKVKSVKAVKYVPPVLVSSIVLNKQTASLGVDSTMTLSATVLPENAADKSYSWSSDDIAVADVDQNGVVIGHNAGTANIIATANDGSGAKDTCVVTVLSPVILDGVTLLYASNEDNWSTVIGYNPGLMYQDGDNVRLTSNGAFLYYDDFQTSASEIFNPLANDHYQWMRVIEIGGSEFYYHQGETWQDAIDANRQGNNDWSIHGGQVKFMDDLTLIDTDGEPVDPSATIDPTVDYGYIME